jgi:Flp pilus assembly pilin Flp
MPEKSALKTAIFPPHAKSAGNDASAPRPTARQERSLLRSEKGQALSEYLILLFLIALVSIAGVTQLGTAIKNRLESARKQIATKVDLGTS